MAGGFTHRARVGKVNRHLSPFLLEDKLSSSEERRFTWGSLFGEEILRAGPSGLAVGLKELRGEFFRGLPTVWGGVALSESVWP